VGSGDYADRLPHWIRRSPGFDGVSSTDVSRAFAAGLAQRRLEDTVRDTLEAGIDRTYDHPAGIDPAREEELLRAWHARTGP